MHRDDKADKEGANAPPLDCGDLEAQADLWLRKADGARLREVASAWLARDPESAAAWRHAGWAEFLRGERAVAEQRFCKALSLDPRSVPTRWALAALESARDRRRAAIDHLKAALEVDPADADVWAFLGDQLRLDEDATGARRCAERALALDPGHSDALLLLANLAPDDTRGAAREALPLYERALAADPESAATHHAMGVTALRAGDVARAEAGVRRALELDPTDADARRTLFLVLRRRSVLYRVLCAPRDLAWAVLRRLAALPTWGWILGIVALAVLEVTTGVPLATVFTTTLKVLLAVLVLWFALVWPVAKLHEAAFLADLRSRSGDVGARRGGWFGFHRLPLAVRGAVFLLGAAAFWGGAWWVVTASGTGSTLLRVVGGLVSLALLLGWVAWAFELRAKRRHRRRRRELEALETSR